MSRDGRYKPEENNIKRVWRLVKYLFSTNRLIKSDCYDSIHNLPIGIFQQIIKTGNHSLLIKKGKENDKYLSDKWHRIYDEFLKEFGVPDQYKQYIKLKLKWAKEIERVWLKGEKWRLSFADIAKMEAEQLINNIESDFTETLAYVSKGMSFRVNPNTVTVYEFYSYVKTLEKRVNG